MLRSWDPQIAALEAPANITLSDLYHLDYLNLRGDEPTEVFSHRQDANARRMPVKKLDLSQIEDPLFAQAAACCPPTPISPVQSPSALRHDSASYFESAVRSQSPANKTREPASSLRRSASPSGSESESEYESDGDYETDDSHLLTHTRVYALAEKYDIPPLKSLAKAKFEMAMACYYDSPEFADAIEEVYCTTIDSDRGLRDVVLQAFRSHPQLASTQDVFGVIKETPTLAFDLWKVERGLPTS